ncbi:MAG: HPF/RaiA family ribosome-associated protein [Candidatus Promineifilaceae bacterium]
MSDEVDELDFTLELNSEYLPDELEDNLFTEADRRLRSLAKGHHDLVGAAVTLKKPAHNVGTPIFEATVVTYVRPSNIAATEKADNPIMALKGALNGVERQIRKKRSRLKNLWEKPGNDPVSQEVEEIEAAESS